MDYIQTARMLVAQYFNERAEKTDNVTMNIDDTYVVWFCYVLGGWKALVSTVLSDGMYYEVTHNVMRGETYLDAYKKFDNIRIPDAELPQEVPD